MNKLRLAVLLLVCSYPSLAQDPRQIITEVQKRSHAESEQYQGLLQVIESGGKITDKRWTYDRIGSHGNSKAIIRFTEPAEVKGVALLIVNHPDRASDQWMWTPALNRDRRIAQQDRSTRFFGTDFSFEDLEERDVDQFDYSYKGEDTIDGEPCWKIESKPQSNHRSQYTSSLLWVRKSNYTYAAIENYRGDKLIRRLKYKNMENVQGIWTSRLLEMEDLTRKSRTILKLDSLKYNAPLKEDQFTVESLRRG
ncbi:MAG TPA: outer membrane lipoprotein-sorting protein [Bryobacteraceae bacterium]|nr:outer membrane lipoprotein-sorting protein [Bryobacteraceae bacterium]